MVVVVREGGVDVGEGQVAVGFDDVVGRHAEVLVLGRDLAHLDVGARHHGPGRRSIDVIGRPSYGLHDLGPTRFLRALPSPDRRILRAPPTAGSGKVQFTPIALAPDTRTYRFEANLTLGRILGATTQNRVDPDGDCTALFAPMRLVTIVKRTA